MRTLSVDALPSVSELADHLDHSGVICLDDVLPAGWLEDARASVHRYIDELGDHDFFLVGPAETGSEPAKKLVDSPRLLELMKTLSSARYPRSQEASVATCLRVLTGPSREGSPLLPLRLHYDASVVTVVVPIFIPDGEPEQSGELVAFPNHRSFRRFIAVHIADKLRTHNAWYRRRAVDAVRADPGRFLVRLEPGGAYVFWGYRAYHGNMPCAPGHLRATLILQYGDPHRSSPIRSLLRVRRSLRMRRWGRHHTVRSAPVLDE